MFAKTALLNKPATTQHDIHPLLRDRWSPRAFDLSPLPASEVRSLLEAARWSPSAGNGQPWSFIVVPRDDQDAFARLTSTLAAGNLTWAQQVPLLVVAVAHTLRDDGSTNAYAPYDLGQAVAHLSVQAAAQGLVVHQMAGFSADGVREAFAVPEGFQPLTVLAIGHQGDAESLPEGLRDREKAPRTRKPLETFVFGTSWGVPAAALSDK